MSERTVLVQCLQDQRCTTKPLDTFESKTSIELHNMGAHLGSQKENH